MKALFIFTLGLAQILRAQPDNQDPALLLDSAFIRDSNSLFDSFLDTWRKDLPQSTDSSIAQMSPSVRAVYDVFATFLSAHMPDTVLPFYVLQNQVYFKVVDHIGTARQFTPARRDSITDFCPRLPWLRGTALFLSGLYKDVLYTFIGQDPHGRDTIRTDELNRRLAFLKRRLLPLEGHWGGYWSLITGPYIHVVYLSRNGTNAKIMYSYADYSWWICTMVKTAGGWETKQDRMNSIQ